MKPFPREVYKTREGCSVREARGINKHTGQQWGFIALWCETPINFREKRK